MGLRKEINTYRPGDQQLTVNDFVVKAVALTLRQFPNRQAKKNFIDLSHNHLDQFVQRDPIDIMIDIKPFERLAHIFLAQVYVLQPLLDLRDVTVAEEIATEANRLDR